MPPKLGGLIGKTVWISIPALFDDGKARPYRLSGIELHGLWLESSELVDRLLETQIRNSSSALAAFVPFAQIASMLILTAPRIGTGAVSGPTSQALSFAESAVPTQPATPTSSAKQSPTKKK
jgi:hypothetical protein